MVADELGRLSSKLGMLHSAKGTNTVRVVFIVDPKGVLRLMLFYPQEAGRNVAEILRVLNEKSRLLSSITALKIQQVFEIP